MTEQSDKLQTRVIKIGGSLFRDEDLITKFVTWIEQQSEAMNLILAGGGELADIIRAYDQRHGLGEEAAHWIAIETMKTNALVISHRFGLNKLAQVTISELKKMREKSYPIILDPVWFMREIDPFYLTPALPAIWEITSDSIAARVAEVYQADELVLLKSTLPADSNWKNWGDQEYVDPAFVKLCPAPLELRCVSLRDEEFPQLVTSITSHEAKSKINTE